MECKVFAAEPARKSLRTWRALSPLRMKMRKLAGGLLAIAILFFSVSAFTQSNTVFISDNNGNQAVGTVDGDGNVFFHDNNGDLIYGTIRGGNVFLNTSKGDVTFGTVRDGNVFLTDERGEYHWHDSRRQHFPEQQRRKHYDRNLR